MTSTVYSRGRASNQTKTLIRLFIELSDRGLLFQETIIKGNQIGFSDLEIVSNISVLILAISVFIIYCMLI